MNLTGSIPSAPLQAAGNLIRDLPTFIELDGNADPNKWLDHCYLHWSVEAPGWNETLDPKSQHRTGFYNFVIDQGKILPSVAIGCNAIDLNENSYDYAAHTASRNSHALGVAINAMDGDGVTPYDFGAHPPTQEGIELLCACVAAICQAYMIVPEQILSDGEYAGQLPVLTHGEAAILDKYFISDNPQDRDCRWDLMCLEAQPTWRHSSEFKSLAAETGTLLRARIAQYMLALR